MQKLITALLAVLITVGGTNTSNAQTPASQGDQNETREQALKLIKVPDPTFRPTNSPGTETVTTGDPSGSMRKRFRMKDGKYLSSLYFAKKRAQTTVILLHGVLSTAERMGFAAAKLRDAANADVFAIDIRGHGRSQGKPGDVSHIDQYAEDVAEIVDQVRKDRPKNRIVLAGHSMGGGIALRFAMLKEHPPIDGLLLFAPLLGQNSPTFPQPTAAKSNSKEEPFLKIHIERLIGLKMLNSIGDHQYDDLNVLFFNVPPDAPIKAYSYRANESMAPVNYAEGLKAVDEPLLVLVGSKDEAFTADAFENAVRSNSKGEVFVVKEATHTGITQDSRSMAFVKEWISAKVADRIQR